MFFEKSDKGFVCTLCPHFCNIEVGKSGFCKVRSADKDGVYLNAYGKLTHIAVEPIEKKPIKHYLEGTKTLSIGSYSCNMTCAFCLPKDSLISTPDGPKQIDQIEDGEEIFALDNSNTGQRLVLAHAGRVFDREAEEVIVIEVDGGKLELTLEHPVMTKDRGWVEAGDLISDDEVLCVDNNLEFKKIKSIKRVKKTQKVYNFNVPGYESYVANGFVVHNCENSAYSQDNREEKANIYSAEDIVTLALKKKCSSVCMTYNEPTIYYEYLLDIAVECKKYDIKFILKTNAYLNKGPWEKVCKFTSAMNIDFKGMGKPARRVTGVEHTYILDRITEAYKAGVHIEISIPVYHGIFEGGGFHELGEALHKLRSDIPIHLLKIYPANRHMRYPTTSNRDMSDIFEILSTYSSQVSFYDGISI
jgi:pyruvate-formate lyase-activating enzyme